MAIVPMADAKFGEPGSSGEYNKVTSNIRDLDGRTKSVETRTTDGTTGNAALSTRISTVETRTTDATTGNTALGTRAAQLETNQGVRGAANTIYAEIAALKTGGGGSAYSPVVADDFDLYGDVLSSRKRADCWWGEEVGNGYLTISATRAAKTFTAASLKFNIASNAAGSGTFQVKLYTGTSLSNLAERYAVNLDSNVTGSGMKTFSIPNVGIVKGNFVAIAMLGTGYATAPKASSTAVGSGFQHLISETPYSVYKQFGSVPTTLNLTEAGWTKSNQQFWFALA